MRLMQVDSYAETDLSLDVVIDQDAEPVDLDEALADFLLRFVQRIHATTVGTPGDGPVDQYHRR